VPSVPAPTDFTPFRERLPWIGPHLQTIRNTIVQPRFDLGQGELLRFPMADGTGDVLLGMLNRPADDHGHPLVVLAHGLTGCAESFYMQATACALLAAGRPVLRLNLRGAGPSAGSCRQRYHAGRTQDLRRVLSQLPDPWPARGVVMAGYSLGGNAILKFLGEGDFPVPVLAGASVSAPIDLRGTSLHFMLPRNRFYHRWLLTRMKQETAAIGPGIPPEISRALAEVTTVWDFDDRIAGPWNGWSGAEEYYAVNNARQYLPRISVPTLVMHALDDPWIPGGAYTEVEWRSNPNLVPLLPRRGGHVGFHGKDGVWHDRCLVRFPEKVVGGAP